MRRLGSLVVVVLAVLAVVASLLVQQRDAALVFAVLAAGLVLSSSVRRRQRDGRWSTTGVVGTGVACVLVGGALVGWSAFDEDPTAAIAGVAGTVLAALGSVGLLLAVRGRDRAREVRPGRTR